MPTKRSIASIGGCSSSSKSSSSTSGSTSGSSKRRKRRKSKKRRSDGIDTAWFAGTDVHSASSSHSVDDSSRKPTGTAVACTATATATATAMSDSTRVAVLVPFRDTHPTQQRRTHLDAFVPYMTDFLRRHCAATSASFHLFILEQSLDGRKFNRGKLLNAGFDMACTDYDVYIFHDVDLLPADSLNAWYTTVPHHGPVHIARVWDRYRESPTYFGGIVAFTREQFTQVNGYPNTFWGWGGEDDELYCRVVHKHLTVQAPTSGAVRDLEEMNLNEKLAVLRANKWKCTVKRELLKEHRRTWQKNGLKGLHYEYVDAEALNEHCTKITIHLGPNGHWSDSRSSLETSPAMASCPASTSAVVPGRSRADVKNDETTATVDTTGTASTHVP